MVWLWAPDGSAAAPAPLAGTGGPAGHGPAGQSTAASLDFQAPGLRPWQQGWNPLAGPGRLTPRNGFQGGSGLLPGGHPGSQPLGAAGMHGHSTPSASLPGGSLPNGVTGRIPGGARSASPDALVSGRLPGGVPERMPPTTGARSASPARPGVNGFGATELAMHNGTDWIPGIQGMQRMQMPTPGAPTLHAPTLTPPGGFSVSSLVPSQGSMGDLLHLPAKEHVDQKVAHTPHGHLTPAGTLSPTPSVQILPPALASNAGPTAAGGKQTVSNPNIVTVQQMAQQFPNNFAGAPRLQSIMQSVLRPEQASGQAVEMPTSLLARIDGVVAEMERELSEEDGHEQGRGPVQTPQQLPNGVKVLESDHTIDWLDHQILAIEQRRAACEMRQNHLAELRRIVAEGESDVLPGKIGAAENGGALSVGNADGMYASDHDEEFLQKRPAGRLSMLEADHNLLKKQVLEYEQQRNNARTDHTGVVRERAVLEEELRITKNAAERAAEVANERLAQAVMQTQELHGRLREAEAAAERERHFSEEAVEAQQSAEADLRTLEEKSRDVLQDCRTLQAKVIELEADRLQHGEAHVTTAQRVSELERELADVRGSSLSLESDARQAVITDRLRISELEAALADRSSPDGGGERRIAELENELIDLRAQHEHHQHYAKITTARVTELEGQLGEHRATIDYYENQARVNSEQIQQYQEQLGNATASETQHVQQHEQKNVRISELESLLSEANKLKDHHASQSKELDTQKQQLMEEISALRDAEVKSSKALAAHRDKVSELEQHAESQELAHNKFQSFHRSRIQELEDELESARSMGEGHVRQLSNHRASLVEKERENEELQVTQERQAKQQAAFKKQISDLEQQLADAESQGSNHVRQNKQHRLKINELEQALEEARIVQENYVSQQGSHRVRIAELERELEEAQSGHDGQVRQQQILRMQISELEQRLLESESGVETRALQEIKQRDQIAALERELEDASSKVAHHRRTHVDLEQEVEKLRETHNNHLEHRSGLEQKNSELEQELEQIRQRIDQLTQESREVEVLKKEFDIERQSFSKMQQDDQERIVALEEQLAETSSHKQKIIELEETNQMMMSNQMQMGKAQKHFKEQVAAAEKQVTDLKRQLQEEQLTAQEQKDKADKMQLEMQTMQEDSAEVVSKQDMVIKQQTIELEEAKAQIANLQSKLEQRPRSSTTQTRGGHMVSMYDDLTGILSDHSQASGEPTSQMSVTPSMVHRNSLSVELTARRPSELKAMLLPASNDPFVEKVRQVDSIVSNLFTEASEIHADSIHKQMESALQAYNSGLEVKDSVQNYAVSATLEASLDSQSEKVVSAINDLRNLEKDIDVQGQLTAGERALIQDRIQMNIKKLDDEQYLLRSRTGMRDVPESTMMTLIGVHGAGVSTGAYSDGFTPMHWAAQQGRRDIVEYLLRLEGGRELLNARDNGGRVPLYYAQKSKKDGLVHYLREVGATAPMHTEESRPNVSGLPSQYLQVLQQIESYGWQAMNWKDGYTMLHWSADKGYSDLCRYLVCMDADPNMRDGKDRLPIEMANEAGHMETVGLLKELMANPLASRGMVHLSPFIAGKSIMDASASTLMPGSTTNGNEAELRRGSTYQSQFGDDEDASSSTSVASKGIPEAYWNVMQQIDKVGWDKMQWARGFTLLHWAAKNDMPDLCSHFMFVKADPNHKDENGRSAFDYASQEHAKSALEQLHRGPPAEEPKMQAFHKSSRKRNSILVEAQPRASVLDRLQ